MTRLLMGVETEYAVSGIDSEGAPLDVGVVAEALIWAARKSLVHLPTRELGVFLGNGGRFYIDHGGHPEYSTPECNDPWELVKHIEAGHRILLQLARVAEEDKFEIGNISVFRGNVDYSGTGSTWGSHESYCHRGRSEVLADQLIPHLVTRIVFTGAGGFVPASGRTGFTLSPRVHHLTSTISGSSTSDRGIFHAKDEALAGPGFRRLHIICGESLCSQTASLLRLGTTALIVALIDGGKTPGTAVTLSRPLTAMQKIALDPGCRQMVRLSSGESRTAVDIQRVYLQAVEENLGGPLLPEWAPRICQQWRKMLDTLESSPETLSTTLDWRIKEELYRAHAARAGFDLNDVEQQAADAPPEPTFLDIGLGDEDRSARSRYLQRVLHFRRRERVAQTEEKPQSDVASDPNLRKLVTELYRTDTMFSQVGNDGIFAALDAAGVLEHQVEGVGSAEQAMTETPEAGRARVRGEAIQKLAGQGRRGRCSWTFVNDDKERKTLRLEDPFVDSAKWVPFPEPSSRVSRNRPVSERPKRDFLDLLQSIGL